jgi:hypothetical protein
MRTYSGLSLHEHDSTLRILSEPQQRALRALAWRHVRSINPTVARAMWVRARKRA